MYRIDSDGAVDALFQDGNPQVGQEATVLAAEWLNAVQEGLCRLIEHSGLVVDRTSDDQIWQAITRIATGLAGGGGGGGEGAGAGAVPATRIVQGGGLVTGGGDLSGDRTLSVARALAGDILAGVRADAAITPDQLAAAIGAAAGESFAFPGGRIVKEGELRQPMQPGVATVVFATPFPGVCRKVMMTPVNTTGSGARDTWLQLVSRSAASFTYCVQTSATGGDVSLDGLDWEATGY